MICYPIRMTTLALTIAFAFPEPGMSISRPPRRRHAPPRLSRLRLRHKRRLSLHLLRFGAALIFPER
jgi:hypothetical protein